MQGHLGLRYKSGQLVPDSGKAAFPMALTTWQSSCSRKPKGKEHSFLSLWLPWCLPYPLHLLPDTGRGGREPRLVRAPLEGRACSLLSQTAHCGLWGFFQLASGGSVLPPLGSKAPSMEKEFKLSLRVLQPAFYKQQGDAQATGNLVAPFASVHREKY